MALTLIYTGDVDGADDWCQLVDGRHRIAAGRRRHARPPRVPPVPRRLRAGRSRSRPRAKASERARSCSTAIDLVVGRAARAVRARPAPDRCIGPPGTRAERRSPSSSHGSTRITRPTGSRSRRVSASIALAEGRLDEAEAHANEAIEAAGDIADPDFWFTVQPHYVRGLVHARTQPTRRGARRARATCPRSARSRASSTRRCCRSSHWHACSTSPATSDAARDVARSRRRRLLRRRSTRSRCCSAIEETEAMFAIADQRLRPRARSSPTSCTSRAARVSLRPLAARARRLRGGARVVRPRSPSTSVRDRIELLLLRARMALTTTTSLDLVAQALALGEADGYVRIFVDEARGSRRSSGGSSAAGRRGFAAEIAAAIVAEPDRHASLQEPRRALRIANRRCGGSSRRRSRCRRSPTRSTCRETRLKSHVRSIYRKLGVSTREAAVGRGHGTAARRRVSDAAAVSRRRRSPCRAAPTPITTSNTLMTAALLLAEPHLPPVEHVLGLLAARRGRRAPRRRS